MTRLYIFRHRLADSQIKNAIDNKYWPWETSRENWKQMSWSCDSGTIVWRQWLWGQGGQSSDNLATTPTHPVDPVSATPAQTPGTHNMGRCTSVSHDDSSRTPGIFTSHQAYWITQRFSKKNEHQTSCLAFLNVQTVYKKIQTISFLAYGKWLYFPEEIL